MAAAVLPIKQIVENLAEAIAQYNSAIGTPEESEKLSKLQAAALLLATTYVVRSVDDAIKISKEIDSNN